MDGKGICCYINMLGTIMDDGLPQPEHWVMPPYVWLYNGQVKYCQSSWPGRMQLAPLNVYLLLKSIDTTHTANLLNRPIWSLVLGEEMPLSPTYPLMYRQNCTQSAKLARVSMASKDICVFNTVST